MKSNLLASAPSRAEITKCIQRFFFSPSAFFDECGNVYNSKGQIESVRVVVKGSRYRFEQVEKG